MRRRLIRRAFASHLVSRVTGRRHVVVLGDSHTEVMRSWAPDGWWFQVLIVRGATASGIQNPNSRSEALPLYRDRLAGMKRFQEVLVLLGEVDCGYIVWRRAQARGTTAAAEMLQSVDRYMTFLVEAQRATDHPVLVLSAPLPTLPDESSMWGEVAQQRADVQISQLERTAMTRDFNDELCRQVAAAGMVFVDAATEQLDVATGRIHAEFVRADGDHHLVDAPHRRVIARALALV